MGIDIAGDLIVGGLALAGIGIGFLLNEQARRRHRIEDALAVAEGAVAGASASMNFIQLIDTGFAPNREADVQHDFQVHAAVTARDALAEARKRLTEVLPYVPELRGYLDGEPFGIVKNRDEIVRLLSSTRGGLFIRRKAPDA